MATPKAARQPTGGRKAKAKGAVILPYVSPPKPDWVSAIVAPASIKPGPGAVTTDTYPGLRAKTMKRTIQPKATLVKADPPRKPGVKKGKAR